jgi:hypothetical protein
MDMKCTFYLQVYEPTLSLFAKEGGLTGKSPAEVAKGILYQPLCLIAPLTFLNDVLIIYVNI